MLKIVPNKEMGINGSQSTCSDQYSFSYKHINLFAAGC